MNVGTLVDSLLILFLVILTLPDRWLMTPAHGKHRAGLPYRFALPNGAWLTVPPSRYDAGREVADQMWAEHTAGNNATIAYTFTPRGAVYMEAIETGALSPDEVRERWGFPPTDGIFA